MKRFSWLVILLLLSLPSLAQAQLWRGIIDPARAIDWQTAVGVSGGIPSGTWTQCGSTIAPYTGSAATINNAIAACGANQFVRLGTGTFSLSSPINLEGHPNVAVRGGGALTTKIVMSSGSSTCGSTISAYACMGSSQSHGTFAIGSSTTWTAGYAQGATVITLGSVAGISANPGSESILTLDQDDDAADTGNVVMSIGSGFVIGSVPDARSCGGASTGVTGTPVSGCTGQTAQRSQQQMVKVTAINGNNVTIFPGLYMPNWRSSHNPGAWWQSSPGRHNGFEDVTFDMLALSSNNGVQVSNCFECWLRNVRILVGANFRTQVQLYRAYRTEIRDSYLYSTHTGGGAQSYGFESFSADATLVINTISHHNSARWLIGVGSANTVAYNYSFDDTSSGNFFWADQMDHDASTHNFYEGNQGAYHVQDTVHGPHMFHTDFRNQFTGNAPQGPATKTAETSPEIIMSHSRYANVIGSVLGTTGYHNRYQNRATIDSASGCDRSIYALGYTDTSCQGPSGGVPLDGVVATTLMRWGNCDAVTGFNACKFDITEVPSGISPFPNAVPASQTLPASFLYSSKPAAWWGTPWGVPAWPAVGPDVTGGDVPNTGGRAYKNPARLCFENAGGDPAYPSSSPRILNFDSKTCYIGTSGVGPTAPSQLRVQ